MELSGTDLAAVIRFDRDAPPPDLVSAAATVLQRHTEDYTRVLISGSFEVAARAAQFENGPWCIVVVPVDDLPVLTPEEPFIGTNCAGVPLHITLHDGWDVDAAELANLIDGVYQLQFERQYGSTPDQTAYIIRGELMELCAKLEERFWFWPRYEWHISM